MCEFLFCGNYYYYQQCQGWKITSRKQKWADDVQPPVPWKLLLPHPHGGPPPHAAVSVAPVPTLCPLGRDPERLLTQPSWGLATKEST